MSTQELHTEPKLCQCAVPTDCGGGGCGGHCGPQVGNLDLLGHLRIATDQLVSTCCESGERVHFDFGNGHNWLVSAWPYITDCGGPPVYVVLPPRRPLRFCVEGHVGACDNGGNYIYQPGYGQQCSAMETPVERSGDQRRYQLDYDRVLDEFVFSDADGSIWRFAGFRPDRIERGRFKSMQAPGRSMSVSGYTGYGHPQSISFSDSQQETLGSISYQYEVGADDVERVISATQSAVSGGQPAALQRVTYTYYGGGSYGSPGDLRTATLAVYENDQWVDVGVHYYRYFTDTDRKHLIQYALDPEAYARLQDDPEVSDPLTATNEQVARYATQALDHSASGLVTWRKPLGGAEVGYAYQVGDETSDDFNRFTLKTVATHADGSVRTTYTNFHNQPLLEEFRESASASTSTLTYREYNEDGNLTLEATPSALAGYSLDGYEIVPQYQSEGGLYNVGMVHLHEYYDETTTGTGGGAVTGFRQRDLIRQGRDGTPLLQRSYEYAERSIDVPMGEETSSSSSSSSSSGCVAPSYSLPVATYPLARETRYRNDDGTGAIETESSYGWHSNSLQMQERVTTLPAIPESQNGSGVSATRTERFDESGNLIWLKDERGYLTYHEYDAHGNMTRSIQDVDDSLITVPTGWSTPADGGRHLITDFEHDLQGRQVQVLGPEHEVDGQTVRTAAWTVYLDGDRETRSAQGFAVESSTSSSSSSGGGLPSYDYTLVNPVSIQKRNASGTRSESIQATRASTTGKLSASDTFEQTSYVRWSVNISNAAGQQIATRVYHTIPASGDGSAGTNYDETTIGYDFMGRQNMVKSPGGTIRRTVFDTRGRVVCSYVGTDDSGATDTDPTSGREPCSQAPSGSSSSSSSSGTDPNNNMVLVSEQTYHDTDCAGCSGGGGQLASSTQYVDADTTRTTEFLYDWRNRREYVIAPPDDQDRTVYTRYQFNNLDQVVRVERYQEQYPNADVLISRQESYFDDLGRTYETRRYAVDPDTGTVGNYLAGYSWFDAAGNSIKQQGEGQRSFTKTQFDSLGRAVKQFVGYDLSETPGCTINSSSSSSSSSGEAESYTVATNVDGDTILEQTETEFDAAGNTLLVISRQRRHDATGTGELSTMSGSQPQARVSYVAYWFDEVGRQKAVANFGTNGDASLSRPATVPSRSDTVLVTTSEFNSAGQAYKTIDPAEREDRQEFDDAGRVVKSIQNYQDGSVNASYPDEDVTVETAYTADGQIATLTAKNPATGDQVTMYVYGTTLDDSDVARKDLLRAEIYPDSDDVADPLGNGVDGVFDRVEFKYNRQGERIEKKDQNGTVHVYEFDSLGRVIHDRVTTLGTGIDGAVRRTSTTYEVRGMREKVTSYDSATSGSVVNEVAFEFNDLAMVTREYQEHEGAKDANTLYVQYNFDESASGGKFTKSLRPSSVRYPNGRLVHFTYGSTDSTADVLNRLDAIKDDSSGSPGDVLASYSYLGLGTIVVEDYQQPDVQLEYFFDSSYAGFDRFGRVVDQRWYDYGASVDRDRYTYGYDRASNRLYRENATASGKDEFYTYDRVNRLVNSDRGDLNVGKTAISGTPVHEEDWNLDMTGNWSGYAQKTSGTTDLDQDRTHNEVNEIVDISETTGTAWATPVHDRAGNMTSVPKPASLANSLSLKWDAWNRLVEAKDGEVVIGVYEYDALQRRVKRHVDSQAPDSPNGIDTYLHYFYNSAWQVLETRDTTTESDQPENLQPDWQYVWSPRYIDAPVLRDRNTDADGLCDDERIYYLGDANFNVTALVDTGGDAIERYLYDAYGRVTVYDDSWVNVRGESSFANVALYTGRERDAEMGLCNCRHRTLTIEAGRFASRDSNANERRRWRPYLYVGASPSDMLDPSGKTVVWFESRTQVVTDSDSLLFGDPDKPDGSTCEIALYDGDDIRLGASFQCSAEQLEWPNGHAIPVDEKGQGIQAAVDVAANYGCCIQTLHLFDHGSPGMQEMGDVRLTDAGIKKVCGRMCSGSSVQFWGCKVGASSHLPSSIMRRFLRLCPAVKAVTGCSATVTFPSVTYFCGIRFCGSKKPNCDGTWNTIIT